MKDSVPLTALGSAARPAMGGSLLAPGLMDNLAKSLADDLAKNLVDNLARSLVGDLAKNLVDNLEKSLADDLEKSLVDDLAKSLVDDVRQKMYFSIAFQDIPSRNPYSATTRMWSAESHPAGECHVWVLLEDYHV